MDITNIFLTSDLGDTIDDIDYETQRFVFGTVGPNGLNKLADGPVWVFIDWVMDDLAGLELCRRLRADPRTRDAHITMVLEEDIPEDRRRSLRAGADDYLIGPLDRNAVLDRVLALQSRGEESHMAHRIEIGALSIDMTALLACWNNVPIVLRPNEFRLLRFLAENRNRVLTRDDLINGMGKSEPPIDQRTVDVWVGRLRRAIKAAGGGTPLRTVRTMGYVFDLE